jgi:DnaJ-class molecular chaperone
MSTVKKGAPGVAPKVEVTCAFCQGRGTLRSRTCQVCGGRGAKTMRAPVARCLPCRGTGHAPGSSQLTCSSCNGVGHVTIPVDAVPCPACAGTGRNREHPDSPLPCARCRGKGVVAPTVA